MSAGQGVDENTAMDSQPSDKEETKPSAQGAAPKAKQAVVSFIKLFIWLGTQWHEWIVAYIVLHCLGHIMTRGLLCMKLYVSG